MPYEAFRTNGGPTLYDSNKTPETFDVLEAGFIFATCILTFSLLIMLPGYPIKQLLYQLVKILLGVFITASIIICNFGQEWEVAHVSNALTQYKAGLNAEIHADVEAKIGLRSINITLKGRPEYQEFDGKVEERINYNERFSWNDEGWLQGRAGFGPFAGWVNRQYREAQLKGLPYPILWIAEYFVLDGEGIRWGRYYRQAGWYSHIMVWLAFPLWLLTMVLFHLVLHYGAYLSMFTGLVLLTANIIYGSLRNPLDLKIPINESAVLEFEWGWCFYLNLFTGLLCITIGGVIWLLHIFCFEQVSSFFGSDVLAEYEEYYLDPKQLQIEIKEVPLTHDRKLAKSLRRQNGSAKVEDNDIELQEANGSSAQAAGRTSGGGEEDDHLKQLQRRFKKKNTLLGTSRFQKSRKYQQRPSGLPEGADNRAATQEEEGEDDDMYENWTKDGNATHHET